jgi:hypothetical protein
MKPLRVNLGEIAESTFRSVIRAAGGKPSAPRQFLLVVPRAI